jgi:hypothetical protein
VALLPNQYLFQHSRQITQLQLEQDNPLELMEVTPSLRQLRQQVEELEQLEETLLVLARELLLEVLVVVEQPIPTL